MPEHIDLLINDRQVKYGDFYNQSRVWKNLKEAMQDSDNWTALGPHMQEALEMIQLKIARILNGDPNHKNSWEDIVGYAELINKNLQ